MPTTLRYPHYITGLALTLGIYADRLFYGRWPGISVPLFVGCLLAGLASVSLIEGRWPAWANLWLGAAALWFALCMALRTELLLQFLNLTTCLALLVLLVATYRGKSVLHMPIHHSMQDSLVAIFDLSWRPAPLLRQSLAHLPRYNKPASWMGAVGRGLLVATPVVACFTLLLMAADSVFASYVEQAMRLPIVLPYDLLTTHAFVVGIVAWVCAGGLLVAMDSGKQTWSEQAASAELPAEGDTQRLNTVALSGPLGWVEAMTVLTLVNMLFGSFVLVQATYFFGGLDTLERTGMTYADYARRGFFELLTVACLSLVLLWSLTVLTHRVQLWQRRSFYAGSTLLVFLVLGLLASAFQRMWLYEQAYGFTRLRVYTHSFMLWLALILGLFLVALFRERLRLFVAGGFIAALVYLSLLNLVNPDALIVRENVARYEQNGKIDIYYLTGLSSDAVPALVAALDRLPPAERTHLQQNLEQRHNDLSNIARQSGWPGWHLARIQALNAIDRVMP